MAGKDLLHDTFGIGTSPEELHPDVTGELNADGDMTDQPPGWSGTATQKGPLVHARRPRGTREIE